MPFYANGSEEGSISHVGWSDAAHPLTRGEVDPEFLARLGRLYSDRVKQTRGFQLCPFCPNAPFGLPANVQGEMILLGSAEVHLRDSLGRSFAAPDLIYHYITAHGYCPPAEFIEAVMAESA